MRRAVVLVLACLLAASLAFAGGEKEPAAAPAVDLLKASWDQIVAEAKKEGQVNFYAWYFPDYFKEAAASFEKLYGVKANVIIGDQTAQFNKSIAEKDMASGTMDVMIVGGQWVKTTTDLNLFFGPIKSVIPDADKLAPSLWVVQEGVQTKGYLAPFHRNQTGLLYDPERVKPPLPQTFAELEAWIVAHPRQFGFCDPNKGGSGQSAVHTLIKELCGGLEKYVGDTEVVASKVANWNLAWEWSLKHKGQVTITASNNDSIIRMNGGELALAVAWDDNVKDMMKKGQLFARAKMYIPKMGFAGGGDTMGVLKNSPHKAAALLWIAHITSKDEQAKKYQMLNAYPARTDIAVGEVMLTEEDRKNAIPWFPAPYKAYMIAEFTKNVLMK